MRKEPDSQTSMTDGETIDVANEKEVLLFYKADAPLLQKEAI